jgi:hypothetical protein
VAMDASGCKWMQGQEGAVNGHHCRLKWSRGECVRPPQMLAESLVSKFEAYSNLAMLVSNQNDFAQLDGDGYS